MNFLRNYAGVALANSRSLALVADFCHNLKPNPIDITVTAACVGVVVSGQALSIALQGVETSYRFVAGNLLNAGNLGAAALGRVHDVATSPEAAVLGRSVVQTALRCSAAASRGLGRIRAVGNVVYSKRKTIMLLICYAVNPMVTYFAIRTLSDERLLTLFTCTFIREGETLWSKHDWSVNGDFKPRKTDNGHAGNGALRDGAQEALINIARRGGYDSFALWPHKQEGSNLHASFIGNDLNKDLSIQKPKPQEIVLGMDVDYYPQIHKILDWYQPCLFYTFFPTTEIGVAGGKDLESSYTISDGVVHYSVPNGGEWVHHVWNWTYSDYISTGCNPYHRDFDPREDTGVAGWAKFLRRIKQSLVEPDLYGDTMEFLCWLLRIKRVTTYKCMTHKISEQRRVVVLNPAYQFFTVADVVMLKDGQYTPNYLKRFTFTDPDKPGWNRWTVQRQDDVDLVMLGQKGAPVFIALKATDFQTISHCASISSATHALGQAGYGTLEKKIACAYLFGDSAAFTAAELLKAPAPLPQVHPLYTAHYEDKQSWREIGAPPIRDVVSYIPDIKNEDAALNVVHERVTKQINTKVPPRGYNGYAREFIEMAIPKEFHHKLVPCEVDESIADFEKPRQVERIRQVLDRIDDDATSRIQSFMKKEATGLKAGRLISGFNPEFVVLINCYTRVVREEILHHERNEFWFSPGKTPTEIVAQVREFCTANSEVAENDYSNFDGTVSAWLMSNIIKPFYALPFKAEHKPRIKVLLDNALNCSAILKKFGVGYDPGPGVRSGWTLTCDGNCLINAFICFCAHRKAGFGVKESFDKLGPIFGDDSIFDASVAGHLSDACQCLGMKCKIVPANPELGITYLSRVFVDPLTTETTFQDPLRTLKKLHYTGRQHNVPIEDAALDRVDGYLVNDSVTPFVSHYCRAVQRAYYDGDVYGAGGATFEYQANAAARRERSDDATDIPYWVVLDKGNGWPQDDVDIPKMQKMVALRLGINENDLIEHCARLDSVVDVDGLKDCSYVKPSTALEEHLEGATQDVVVNGDHVGNSGSGSHKQTTSADTKREDDKPQRTDSGTSGPDQRTGQPDRALADKDRPKHGKGRTGSPGFSSGGGQEPPDNKQCLGGAPGKTSPVKPSGGGKPAGRPASKKKKRRPPAKKSGAGGGGSASAKRDEGGPEKTQLTNQQSPGRATVGKEGDKSNSTS
uniref:RNA replicase n=1 Tax=Beihai noda-like virus 26 TaxID=1922480 RepID=A0A1L3KFT4_9VIRU|nr:hypothetical protein [Beihai noda-like virus 26]APG76159.1 hypothetical protein [Beihai noda-like virus 26]